MQNSAARGVGRLFHCEVRKMSDNVSVNANMHVQNAEKAAKNELPQALLGLSVAEIASLIPDAPSYTAKQIRSFCFDGKDIDQMTSLSKQLRAELAAKFVANPVKIDKVFCSKDGSRKFLFALTDGNLIEGVYMPHNYGDTVCVSTQVGCRMGCAFCASGIDGLVRNLTAQEILGEVIAMNAYAGGTAKKRAVTNIVLMGSGEPFDNYDNVMRFLDEVSAPDGINISERNISLSTSGLADKIRRFADSGHKVTLSISLHSPFDEKRSKLMPVNRKFGIPELISAAKYYFEKTGRRVIFEYTLIAGENDSEECARELVRLTKGFPAHINLIRLNEVKEKGLKQPAQTAAEKFLARLQIMGASATLRRSFGEDIEGACGQLRRRVIAENKQQINSESNRSDNENV